MPNECTIWKFPLSTTDRQVLAMPRGATLLSVQIQRGVPCLWALVDSTSPMGKRYIAVYGTGNPIAVPARDLHRNVSTPRRRLGISRF